MNKNEVRIQAKEDYDPSIVSISDEAINLTINKYGLSNTTHKLPSWDWMLSPQMKNTKTALMYFIFANAQAFKFWTLDNGKFSRYVKNGASGTSAMFKILATAWGDNATTEHLKEHLDTTGLSTFFKGSPLACFRVDIVNELITEQKLEDTAETLYNLIQGIQGASLVEAKFLANSFPLAYGDDPYFKKAQLTLAAICGYMDRFSKVPLNSSDLTALADYQVPRVLRALGILEYSKNLAKSVDNRKLIIGNSNSERAIRAATVLAVDKIAEKSHTTAAIVDDILWSSQDLAKDSFFHLTNTTNY